MRVADRSTTSVKSVYRKLPLAAFYTLKLLNKRVAADR